MGGSKKQKFEKICNEYIEAFSKKQELDFEGWVADKIGELALFGDYTFGMDEIRYDIDNEVKPGEILSFQDYCVSMHYIGKSTHINYENYVKHKNQLIEKDERLIELSNKFSTPLFMMSDIINDRVTQQEELAERIEKTLNIFEECFGKYREEGVTDADIITRHLSNP